MEPQNPNTPNVPQIPSQPSEPIVSQQPVAQPAVPQAFTPPQTPIEATPVPLAAPVMPDQFAPPAAPLQPAVPTQQYAMPPAQPFAPMPGKKSKKLLIAAIVVVVVVIAGGVTAAVLLGGTPKVNETTFEKNFTSCKKSYTVAPKDAGFTGDATATILGKKGTGCSVSIKFGNMTGSEVALAHKDMTCELDTSQSLNTALDDALTNPTKYNCSGTLIDYIKSHENN